MKNLVLVQEKRGVIVPPPPPASSGGGGDAKAADAGSGEPITHVCVDSPSKVLYAVGASLTLYAYALAHNRPLGSPLSLVSPHKKAAAATTPATDPADPAAADDDDPLLAPSDAVVSATYLNELEAVCVVARSGHVVLVQPSARSVTAVCTLPARLAGAVWAPEQDLCALATTGAGPGASNQLVLLTRDWDLLYDVPLQPHVAAGAAPDECTALAWRGDGQTLVTNTFTPPSAAAGASGSRCLRVWNREAVLQSASALFPAATDAIAAVADPKASSTAAAAVEGMSGVVAWKPSGQLIATAQRTLVKSSTDAKAAPTVRHDIIFFERNGLRHGEFALPPVDDAGAAAGATVTALAWNSDSTVLMVCVAVGAGSAAAHSLVQFWSVGNYHWYLKQQFVIRGRSGGGNGIAGGVLPGALGFDPEHPLQFACASTRGCAHHWT